MKKKIAALLLCGCMTLQIAAWAAFTDMQDSRWDWARDAIESMTSSGIIKGYEDNTFRPDRSVSKIESLILMARVAGVDEAQNEKFVSAATEAYKEDLLLYDTAYKREVSYLLYKGVLTKDDLNLYVANEETGVALKRYEAAILLTKLLWNNDVGNAAAQVNLTFNDTADIPASAKPYVNYVVSNGIMNGMDGNLFSPMGEVTRAQMATLLYRVMENLPVTVVRGTMVSYDTENKEISINDTEGMSRTYTLTSKALVRMNGFAANAEDISVASDVIINIEKGGTVRLVEAVASSALETVSGIYSKYQNVTGKTLVYIKDPITSESTQYTLASGAAIYKGSNAKKTINDLTEGDSVTLTIQGGQVVEIRAEDKQKTVTGAIEDIQLLPEYRISVKSSSTVTEYQVSSDVEVRRNGKYTDLSDVVVGDSVTLTLTYGVVTKMEATSKQQNVEGSIVQIVIDTEDPMMTIREQDGTEHEYHLKSTAEIKRNDTQADVYDLRLGDKVAVQIEGSTVVSITVSAVGENSTINGIVEYVNTSYGYVKLEGVNELIFVTDAKVTTKEGSTLNVRNIQVGDNITAFCAPANGSYEATLIVIND